jgi:hypothetical protein
LNQIEGGREGHVTYAKNLIFIKFRFILGAMAEQEHAANFLQVLLLVGAF